MEACYRFKARKTRTNGVSPKIRQGACSALSKDESKKDDGLDKLIAKLRELYGVSDEQATFSVYEKFETFQQSEGMNINDYIDEFEQLNQKLVTYKIELPSAVCACQLLKRIYQNKNKILPEPQYLILLMNQ